MAPGVNPVSESFPEMFPMDKKQLEGGASLIVVVVVIKRIVSFWSHILSARQRNNKDWNEQRGKHRNYF